MSLYIFNSFTITEPFTLENRRDVKARGVRWRYPYCAVRTRCFVFHSVRSVTLAAAFPDMRELIFRNSTILISTENCFVRSCFVFIFFLQPASPHTIFRRLYLFVCIVKHQALTKALTKSRFFDKI